MNNHQARLIGPIYSGVAAGGAGVATANSDSTQPIVGELLGVYVEYLDSPPVTTDVVLKTKGSNPPSNTFLTLTNANTSNWFRPMQQGCDSAGSAIAGAYVPILLADFINVKIDQANNSDGVNVYLLVR